jgi:endo-1,4-beta-D-glucanase Y
MLSLLLLLCLCSCQGGKSQPAAELRMPPPVLIESWQAYVREFIQGDGRVIDHSAGGISTSEGQAYAMLRAVWIGDRGTFDRTFTWAVNNLNSGVRDDRLWAWKWGKNARGTWGVLDKAFASDADEDAAYALILAAASGRTRNTTNMPETCYAISGGAARSTSKAEGICWQGTACAKA